MTEEYYQSLQAEFKDFVDTCCESYPIFRNWSSFMTWADGIEQKIAQLTAERDELKNELENERDTRKNELGNGTLIAINGLNVSYINKLKVELAEARADAERLIQLANFNNKRAGEYFELHEQLVKKYEVTK